MRNIKEWLEGFGADAYLHTLAVLVLSVAVARLCGLFVGHIWAVFIGVGVAVLCAVAKEIYDTRKKGFVDVKDYVFDAIGALLFLVVYL